MIESQTLKSFLIVALCFPIVLCGSHWINVHCNFAFAGPLTVIIGIGHFILYLYLANKIRKVQLENYAQTNTSMMGNAIRGAKATNGNTIGVAPFFFRQPGVLYQEGEETLYTRTMRERKAFMESLSSAFITTPGGIGTLEEFYEILTLKQLQQLDLPLILLNTNHYYDGLLKMMQGMTQAGFIDQSVYDLFKVCLTVEEAFEYLDQQLPVSPTK